MTPELRDLSITLPLPQGGEKRVRVRYSIAGATGHRGSRRRVSFYLCDRRDECFVDAEMRLDIERECLVDDRMRRVAA